MRCRILVFALILSACPALLKAQEFRATLLGVISDSTGAKIPDAGITVTNKETGVASRTRSNQEGSYIVSFLNPGTYSIRVEHAGFSTVERSPIQLQVSDRTRLDITLQVGQVSEQVTVTAEAPLLEQATGDRGQVIDNKQVTELPLNGGNPFELMQLAAGAVYTGSMTYTRPFNEGSSYSINGGRERTNEFQIDGLSSNANSSSGFVMGYVPPREATQEFKVQTNTYDAQYGRTGGGVMNLSVKSGTNRFHGAIYEGMRRTSLEANQFANNANAAPRPEHKMDQYGVQLDGPVALPKLYQGKNRTFFMFALERYREGQPQPAIGAVPTPEQRKGDYSKTLTAAGRLYTVYDPLTRYGNPDYNASRAITLTNLRYLRLPFPGNQVPTQRTEPIAQRVLQDIPLPNRPGDAITGLNNWFGGNVTEDNDFQNLLARVDHNITDSWKMYVRWNHSYRDGGRIDYWGWGTPATRQTHAGRGSDGAVLDFAGTLSPRDVLSVRMGFNRYTSLSKRDSYPGIHSKLGFPNTFASQLQVPDNYPVFTFENYLQAGNTPGGDQYSDTYTAQANMVRQVGAHTMKFGGEFRLMRYADVARAGGAGSFSFTRAWTSLSPDTTDPGSGNAYASFLLGYMNSATATINAQTYLSWRYPVAFYQHDWRVNRRLTLNMGIRWDYESPVTERYNRQNRGFDFKAKPPYEVPGMDIRGGLLFAGVNGQARGGFEPDYNHPQPRFGVAYKVLNSKPLVFRGGFGRSFLPTNDFGGTTGFSQVTNAEVSTVEFLAFRLLSDPFPNGLRQPPGASLGLGAQIGDAITFNSQDRTVPDVWQYSAGFQYEIVTGLLVDASYVGSKTRRLSVSKNLNFLTPEQLAMGTAYLNESFPNPFYGVLPVETSRGQQRTIARRTLMLQYPQYTSITMAKQSIGDSWYNGFQLKLQQRSKYGLSYLISYTNSKNLESMAYLNSSDAKLSRELVSYDVSQRLAISGTYEFPIGPKKRWLRSGLASVLVGGWQLSWTGMFQKGPPVTYPDYYMYGNPKLESGQTLDRWFDTSKSIWVQRPPDTLRTTPLRSPNIRRHSAPQVSSTLARNFRIREGHRFQLKVSAFNLTNTPIFGFPNTSPTSPLFGVVPQKQINLPRSIEIGLRYTF